MIKFKEIMIKSVAGLGILLPALSVASMADISPFFGVDIGIKSMGFKSGYGDNIFVKTQKVGSIFAGLELNPNIDVSLSYESTIFGGKKKTDLGATTRVLGGRAFGVNNTCNTKAKFSSVGLDLIYKFKISECENFKPLIGVGIKHAKIKLTSNVVSRPAAVRMQVTESKSKTIFKLMGGAEYMFNNNFGARALLTFENTSALTPSTTIGGLTYTAKLKNSFGASVGAIVRF